MQTLGSMKRCLQYTCFTTQLSTHLESGKNVMPRKNQEKQNQRVGNRKKKRKGDCKIVMTHNYFFPLSRNCKAHKVHLSSTLASCKKVNSPFVKALCEGFNGCGFDLVGLRVSARCRYCRIRETKNISCTGFGK